MLEWDPNRQEGRSCSVIPSELTEAHRPHVLLAEAWFLRQPSLLRAARRETHSNPVSVGSMRKKIKTHKNVEPNLPANLHAHVLSHPVPSLLTNCVHSGFLLSPPRWF